MSLGNVSSARVNQRYFQRAIQLLRAASNVPGYSLTLYLQQWVFSLTYRKDQTDNCRYLDDYGRLVD